MVRANRYLHKRCGRARSGERYYLRVPVPRDLRAPFGRTIERPLRTSDPRVARIRRDQMLPDVRAMFERARQEPKLGQVTAAVRREELARAHIQWSELMVDRGLTEARELVGLLDDDDPWWQRRARRALLHHGLAPDPAAVQQTVGAMFEAHADGAGLALDGRTLEFARGTAEAVPQGKPGGSPVQRRQPRPGQ